MSTTLPPGCGPPVCGPGPGNSPCLPNYMCSLGVTLQGQIDLARRAAHEIGLRPFQVSLVWQEYQRTKQAWAEVERLVLMPVNVRALNSASYHVGDGGLYLEGPVTLDEVSPAQVNDHQLRGWRLIDGQWVNWVEANRSSEREFFYEIQHHRRCPGDPDPTRYRFALGSAIHHDGENFQLVFQLAPQIVARGAGGVDRSIAAPGSTKLRL